MRSTDRVKRGIGAVITIITLLMLPACGRAAANEKLVTPPASAPGSSASSGAPSGSPSSAVAEFTVDGTGPYQIGDKLTDLQTDPGLTNVITNGKACPNNTTAQGTGAWKDVYLSFHSDGTLYLALNRSPQIPTPSGAWLGTSLAQLKTIYAKVQTELLTAGAAKAFLVITLSGGGILFQLNPQGQVVSMAAADAYYLKSSFQTGAAFC